MHPLKGRKQTKAHIANRMAAIDWSKRKPGGGRPANTPGILWAKVDRRGPNECWPWLGWTNEQGYGRTEINGITYYAHRVIYDLANPGVITLSAPSFECGVIRHSCDNPSCCNPGHLILGTHTDNMRDKVVRDRLPDYGADRGPRCKLTMDQAREVRRLRKIGISAKELAVQYAISLPSIKSILRGDTYRED
jgi:hypothetical protein